MRLPLFFPNPTYVAKLPRRGALPLAEVCVLADVACRATGQWTERLVIMESDDKVPHGAVWAEPSGGTVRIMVPAAYSGSARARARYALGVLAYVLFDLVSRESIRGKDWTAIGAPVQALAGLELPMLTPKQAAAWLKDSKDDFDETVRDPWA